MQMESLFNVLLLLLQTLKHFESKPQTFITGHKMAVCALVGIGKQI